MFEVGFTETILILGIALLVLGPEKLPKLASQIGRWAGRARSMARQLRQQLDDEVSINPPSTPARPVRRPPPAAPADPPEKTDGPDPS